MSHTTILTTPDECLGRLKIVEEDIHHSDSDYDPDQNVEEEPLSSDSDEEDFQVCSSSKKNIKTTSKSRVNNSRCSLQQFICSFPNCSAMFPKRYRLDRHERKHTGERPYICDVEGCEKAFTCRSYLNKHMKRPHTSLDDNDNDNNDDDDEGHRNDHDQLSKSTAKSQNESIKKSDPKVIACPECGQTYRHKYGLKVHRASHTGQLPFKCDICDKTFALKSQLKRHEKRHQGYDCAYENCQFHASTWTLLRKHITTQHRLVHKCALCDKTFASHYSLLTHEKLHTGEKLVCPHENCDRSYVKQSNLNIHLKTHTDQRFHCQLDECKKKFKHKISLINHQRTVHQSFKDTTEESKKNVLTLPIDCDGQVKRNKLFSKRISMAQKITGHEPDRTDLQNILQQDKQFRHQKLLLVQN